MSTPAATGAGATTPAPRAAASWATPAGVTAALGHPLAAAGLGRSVGLVVLDPATGATLLSRDGGRDFTPASTVKLLTATAALDLLGPAHRFRTRVEVAGVTGGIVHLVLVGGGDPSLTRAVAGQALSGEAAADPVVDPARLPVLVSRTVAGLRARGVTPGNGAVTVAVDDHLFTGPATAVGWVSSYVDGGSVGPVDSLSLDGGRRGPATAARVVDPARSAGDAFAAALLDAGISVAAGDRTVGPRRRPVGPLSAAATTLAAVDSPRLVDLLHHLLLASDNDYAETLARDVAVAVGRPADFTGSAAAVLDTIAGLGIDTSGAVLLDGSGLSRRDRLSPLLVARVVALTVRDPALVAVPRNLPVAGRSGTLATRFTGAAARARGRVRAKTGTLDGVDTLAGFVRTDSAGQLVVVVLADATPGTDAARSAIDVLVARLVGCGCRG